MYNGVEQYLKYFKCLSIELCFSTSIPWKISAVMTVDNNTRV